MSHVQARQDGSCAPGYSKNINGWCYSLMQVEADPQQSGPVLQRRRVGAEKIEDQWMCLLAGTPCNHGLWAFAQYPQQPYCSMSKNKSWIGQDNHCYTNQAAAAQAPTVYTHALSLYGGSNPAVPPMVTQPEAQLIVNAWANVPNTGQPIVAQLQPLPGQTTPNGVTPDGIIVSASTPTATAAPPPPIGGCPSGQIGFPQLGIPCQPLPAAQQPQQTQQLQAIQLTQNQLNKALQDINTYRQQLLVAQPLSRTGSTSTAPAASSGIPTWAVAVAGVAALGAAYYFLLYKKS